MILLEIEDFEKFHSLAQGTDDNPLLQSYIDRYEEKYIKLILGVILGQLFIDDIQGVDSDSAAIEDRFQKLLDKWFEQPIDCIYESTGMKDILASLVFYHYASDTQVRHTQSGVTLNQSEVSNTLSPEGAIRFGEMKWNDAIPSIHAIQWLCGCHDAETYPEYKGTKFEVKYSPLL